MMISRRSLLLTGAAIPTAAYGQCVTDRFVVDACRGGVRITVPGPSFDQNFLTGSLGTGAVFTRASTGTYYDSAGVLRSAAINTPRFDYDPVTSQPRGLLLEDASTNIALYSADFTQAVWQKQGTPPTVTGDQALAPDGTTTADKVDFPLITGGGITQLQQTLTATAAPYTFSVWMKGSVGGERLYLWSQQAAASYSRLSCTLTTQWQRFSLVTSTLTAGSWLFGIGADTRDASQTPTPAQTIFAWGAQVEAKDFPTSYIATTSVSVTRAIDSLTYPPASMTWFTPPGGSWFAEFDYFDPTPTGGRIVGRIGGGPGALQTPSFPLNSAGQFDGANPMNTVNTTSPNTISKAVSTWAVGQAKLALNGGPVASAANLTTGYPTYATTGIGIMTVLTGAQCCDGHIRALKYWPRVLSDSEMQAVTT